MDAVLANAWHSLLYSKRPRDFHRFTSSVLTSSSMLFLLIVDSITETYNFGRSVIGAESSKELHYCSLRAVQNTRRGSSCQTCGLPPR